MGITIKGIRAIKPEKVSLEEFFDEPRSVVIKPLSNVAKARIQELMTSGISYKTRQGPQKLNIESMEQSFTTEATLEIQNVKLTDAVVEHDLIDDQGKLLPWGYELWEELDKLNAGILAKIFKAIDKISYPKDSAGEDEDPTSPAPSGGKSGKR